ncbi:MAG: metallophosphoesterase [Ruminococcus sp.]|nr:metallophosphoesterase [Ruminococcus sp.]
MKNFNFYQISDLHLYAAERIGSHGKSFDFKCSTDQKCMAESSAIVDAAFQKVVEDKDNEVVILSGDLSFDGEQQSHDLIAEKLKKLKAAGKKVYVAFATHDFHMHARAYVDDEIISLPKYTRAQLRELYNDFGWSDAVSEHTPSYSYAVIPEKGWRFLMLNDDGDAEEYCGYDESQLEWVKEQTEQAKAAGERIIAVTHHPALPPNLLYPLYSHKQMLGGYEKTIPLFADWGIEFIFTGHTHMQSITHLDTPNGNRIYHVNTGSIIAYPAPFRKVTATEDGLDVKTMSIDSFDWDLKGMSVEEYTKHHFEFMLKDIIYSLGYDINHFRDLAWSFSLDEKTVDKFKPLFVLVGKIVNGLTMKTLGRLLAVGSKVEPSVAKLKVKDFILDVICQMYSGVKVYTPDTAEYRAFMPIAARIGKFVKFKDFEGNPVPLEKVIEDLLCETGEFDNTNAFLPYKSK